MLQPKCEFAGAHIHKGLLKAGIALFLREGGLSYPHHYVSKPVIPEGGYPGAKDAHGNPVDAADYRDWLESLPARMVLNPCLTHFIRIDPATTRTQLEAEIQRVFTPDVLVTIDTLLADRGPAERASMSAFRRLMNAPERLCKPLVLPKGYDEALLIAGADNKFKGLSGELDGGGRIIEISPGTIDIGPGAIGRGNAWTVASTLIDLTNPANDTGKLDTFELWFAVSSTGVKAGTFYGSGTSYTNRDGETIGAVTAGSKQTFSGLDCDVESGDFAGVYQGTGRIELDLTGGSGMKRKDGDQFGTGAQTYTSYAVYIISIYGTGGDAITEKSGGDSGAGADLVTSRSSGTTEAGTGAEASELTTSGAVVTGDTGTGSENNISRGLIAVPETGQAAEAASMPAAALITGDSGYGADYSGLPEAVAGADTGQGRDAVRVRIEMAGAGVAMRLPGRPGRVNISRKEVSG